ncbi:NuA4-domain-containing protein [Auriculariales sp. MPI-PUGE-AT-0066]|nr:NuA4-domain-containing protein [Auriculariales sp. MPI-PUGE-AT-0066]
MADVEARQAYETARKKLIEALNKKRAADKALIQIETQIYHFEGSYLAETAQHNGGNIITGFDGYLKNQGGARRRLETTDSDRIFSFSSKTALESLDASANADDSGDDAASAAASIPKVGRPKKRRYMQAGDEDDDTQADTRIGRPSKRARTGTAGVDE